MNADLHCHSNISDGLLAPGEVVRRAHANGVELRALTDHDELGGIAVLAHPARYRVSSAMLDEIFDHFIAAGGEAVEVVAGAHSPDEMLRFASVARRYGLLASRGSDFHGVGESPVDLGRCNPLPPDLVPVWSRLTTFNTGFLK
jgi:predicted metal-dependent phosphoesterase TrpH